MFFENDTILLRAVEPEDLDLLYSWENDPKLWIHGCTRSPYSKYAIRQYIANMQDIYESKQLRLMIQEKARHQSVGIIDLYDFDIHNSRIALGILIAQQHKRKAYAYKAIKLIEKYVFDYLNIHQIYAYVSESNEPSVRLFEKCAYKKSALLIDWTKQNNDFENVFLFQKFKEA